MEEDVIKKFVKNKSCSKQIFLAFLERNFLHPDHERLYMERVANVFSDVTFAHYSSLSKPKRILFLSAAEKFFEVALSCKIFEYLISRKDGAWYWQKMPLYFSILLSNIEPLQEMAGDLKKLRGRGHGKMVFVEGDSEEAFIKSLQGNTRASSFQFEVYNYKGESRVDSLARLIDKKTKEGVSSFLQYDLDGKKSSDRIKKIREKTKLKIGETFAFRYDFEGAFPSRILSRALSEYREKYLTSNNFEINRKTVGDLLKGKDRYGKQISFSKALKERFSIDLDKPKFAEILGEIISKEITQNWNAIVNSKKLPKKFDFEIYRFLNFLIKQ